MGMNVMRLKHRGETHGDECDEIETQERKTRG